MKETIKIIWLIIKKGFFDEDDSTSLYDEIKQMLFKPKGSYAAQIQNVLSAQSNFRLGKYTKNSFGEIWTIIKPLKDSLSNLEKLTESIQDNLSKHGSDRIISFLKNPLRLILYYRNPKPIPFSSVTKFMQLDNRFYPFVIEDKLCEINPEKEEFSHCFIAGITGSGKTVLMKNFIASLRGDSIVYFCNPKNDNSFVEIESLCTEYKVSLSEIEKLIQQTYAQTEQRLQYPNKRKIFLFVDELSLLSKESKELLTKIANIGRSLGVHLVLATQRSTKETCPTELKSQMTYSLTGRVKDKNEAYYASGITDSNAEKLQGAGLFVLNGSGYNNVLVQALLFDTVSVASSVEAIETPNDVEEENEETDLVEVYDYSFDSAPKFILNRREWIETILNTDFTTLKELQDSHKQFYGKLLNHKQAQQIKEWLE